MNEYETQKIRNYIWNRSAAYNEILRRAIHYADSITELEVDIPRKYGRIAAANRIRDLIIDKQIPYLTEHPNIEDLCERTGDKMSYQAGFQDYFRDVLGNAGKTNIGAGDHADIVAGYEKGREEALLAIRNLQILP